MKARKQRENEREEQKRYEEEEQELKKEYLEFDHFVLSVQVRSVSFQRINSQLKSTNFQLIAS